MSEGEVHLQRGEAESIAQEMSTASADAVERFARTEQRLSELSESFRGAAATAFDAQFQQWKQGADQVVQALEDLSTWLRQAAEQISAVDEQLGQGLQG